MELKKKNKSRNLLEKKRIKRMRTKFDKKKKTNKIKQLGMK